MGTCKFVNRDQELKALEKLYEERPGFLIVYGRRRIGKTRLILEWLKSHEVRSVYYLSQLSSHQYNLNLMAETAAEQLKDPSIKDYTPKRLSSFLTFLSNLNVDVIILDEITYWIKSNPIVLSELQEFIDLKLPETSTLLIITGSLLGVMKSEVISGGSPLYARASKRIKLGQLPYEYLKCIVPGLSSEDRVRIYALLGGIPYYICQITKAQSLKDVLQTLLSRDSPIRQEKEMMLREEFRDPSTYNAILSAIAKGYNTPGKISQITGIDPGLANKALHVLEYLEMVKREIPLFRKKGSYTIKDPILNTWYHLIEPVETLLELGLEQEAMNNIYSKIDEHTSKTWETLVKIYLAKKYASKGYTLIGRLVHKNEEIDIALINPKEKKAILAEAKWSKVTTGEIRRLMWKTEDKAGRILPSEYKVEKIFLAVREIKGSKKPSENIITPDTLEETTECRREKEL